MTNILYIHGVSKNADVVNRPSEKIEVLEKLGLVYRLYLNYNDHYNHLITEALDVIEDHDIDLIVGTSMGGYTAAMLGELTGLPFLACNPVLTPGINLAKYGVMEYVLNSYPDIKLGKLGLVAVDMGDEIIDSSKTVEFCDSVGRSESCIVWEGGTHRFNHMKEMVPMINQMLILEQFI
jgi:uncharacterized protein